MQCECTDNERHLLDAIAEWCEEFNQDYNDYIVEYLTIYYAETLRKK